MRLSEIIKNTEPSSPPAWKVPEEPPRRPAEAPPAAVRPAPHQDFSQIAEKIRMELQEKLEKEFKEKLNEIRSDANRAKEELLKSEEEKFFSRAEAFKKEKNQLLVQLEELKNQNQNLANAQQGVEEFKKQMSGSQEKMADAMQKRIAEMEEQLKARPQGMFEEEKKKIEKQVKDELDAATRDKVNELEKKVKDREKKIEELAQGFRPVQAPKIETAVPPPPVFVSPVPASPAKIPAMLNPNAAKEAQEIYNQLVHAGRGIFDCQLKGQTLDLSLFKKVLNRFIHLPAEHQEEMIGIFFDLYPEQEYFLYHAVNTMILAVFLGTDLKLGEKESEELGIATLLHDIALLNVKDSLSYPKELSPALQDEVKNHPGRGAEIIGPYVSEDIKTAVLQHHELSNGKGYPKGLLNDAIHLYAKIINIADSFEAMVHVRPYRQKPYEVSEAVKEMIEKERGLYDREVIKALLSRVGLYPVKSFVELSTKQIARVLRQNRQFPISPVIQLEFDEAGEKIVPPQVVDLRNNQLLHIIGPLKARHSYTKEKLALEKEKEGKSHAFQVFKEILPLLIIAVILGLVVVLVVKI